MSLRRLGLVLLDRDGTLNVKAPEGQYVTSAEELVLLPGAAGAVRRLNEAGVPVAVVSNQRGIGRGRMTEADLSSVHEALRTGLGERGARLDAIHHCPHAHGSCHCRKPAPGLLEVAARELGVPLDAAVMIGDADSDIEAGRRAGARTLQLIPAAEAGCSRADLTAPDLDRAVTALLSTR